MPTNQLRFQAEELLRLARKAYDDGRLADARTLTLKAERLEDAVSLEELRRRHLPKAAVATS